MIRSMTLLLMLALYAAPGCGDDDRTQPPTPQPSSPAPAVAPSGATRTRPASGPVLDIALADAGPIQLAAGSRMAEIQSLDELPAALERFPEAGPAARIISVHGQKDPRLEPVMKALDASGFQQVSVDTPARARRK
jgi:hypothetical protein